MFDDCEFVIEQNKQDLVVQYKTKIERLFEVEISFPTSNSTNGMVWICIKGNVGPRDKAKVCS